MQIMFVRWRLPPLPNVCQRRFNAGIYAKNEITLMSIWSNKTFALLHTSALNGRNKKARKHGFVFTVECRARYNGGVYKDFVIWRFKSSNIVFECNMTREIQFTSIDLSRRWHRLIKARRAEIRPRFARTVTQQPICESQDGRWYDFWKWYRNEMISLWFDDTRLALL